MTKFSSKTLLFPQKTHAFSRNGAHKFKARGKKNMQISSLIGKQVLSPAGEKLGFVYGARLSRDYKKLSCLTCADDDAEEFILPARAILSCGDALIAGNARLAEPTGIPAPVMSPVFTHTGESLGAVCDVICGDEAEPAFVAYHNGVRTEYPLSRTHAGDTLVVYPNAAQKPKTARQKSAKRPPKQTKAPAKPAEEIPVPRPAPATEPAPAPVPPPQNDYSLNRLNLLGRRVKKSVFDGDGNPVAFAGERITPSVISLARRSNRLLELTVNTLTNVL